MIIVFIKTAIVFCVSSQQFNKRPKSLLGMTQLIVFCIDVRRTYVVWNDSFWVNFLSYGTKLMEENKAKLYIL